jgi:ATP-dependent Lon protease
MDIEQPGDAAPGAPDSPGNGAGGDASGRQVMLAADSLPGVLHVLPQEHRPFFPGQAMPLQMAAEAWLPTLAAIQRSGTGVVGLIAARVDGAEPRAEALHDLGTVCRIHRVHQQDGVLQVLLEGLQRFQVQEWLHAEPPLRASVRYFSERAQPRDDDIRAYGVAIINTIRELIPLNPLYGEELKAFVGRFNPNQPSLLADFAASMTSASREDLQQVLETLPLQPRLERVLALLHREVHIARTQMEIRTHVEGQMQKHQREALLRQQLAFIQKELGLTKDDRTADAEAFRGRLAGRELPEAARVRIDDELRKLAILEPGSPEYAVTRNYLDWATALPWGTCSQDTRDLDAAARTLDASHAGLDDAKARIVEQLALGIQRGDMAGSILLLVGPPGVGKTSLGRSIAAATGRRFYRFSVGGMRDEAEIKGHRRTYVGALPGKLVAALKECGTANPVIVLDEVDKIGASYQGDPASALLEVLDPEQNAAFRDHYLDLSVDLSRVLFVCTANQVDGIPPALLDRMETIRLAGYLAREKLDIAVHHLWPRALERAGLRPRDLRIDRAALARIIDGHSREAGVRRLEKALAGIVRKCVVERLRGAPVARVRAADVERYLGLPEHRDEALQRGVGVVTGLAWTPLGGATLPVEATVVHRNAAGLTLTGHLGDVMRESARIAHSYIVGNAPRLGIADDYFANAHLHVHVPAGATPKDGPSAGITIATALLSLARGTAPRPTTAMTGELTLTGHVYPVGGIREKLVAANRQRLRRLVLPAANRRDFAELPESVRHGLDVHFVEHFSEVPPLAFGGRS